MSKQSIKKNEHAKAFESSLNPENKALIERMLDSADTTSGLSGTKISTSLLKIIGDKQTLFLVRLLDAYNTDWITEIKGISSETKQYLYFLYGTYSSRLRNVLSNKLLKLPHSWAALNPISTNYNVDSNDLVIKLALYKDNNECVILEDTADSLLQLTKSLIKCISEKYSKVANLPLDFEYIHEEINQIRGLLETFQKNLPEQRKKTKKKS